MSQGMHIGKVAREVLNRLRKIHYFPFSLTTSRAASVA